MESAIFLLIYLLNNNNLPWSKISAQNGVPLIGRIKERAKKEYMEKLKSMLDRKLYILFRHL